MFVWPRYWRRLAQLVAAGVIVAFQWQPAQAATTLVINQLLPPGDPFNQQVLRPWAAEVQRVTGGRVVVSLPNAPVAAPEQLWNAVLGGIVDGAYIYNGLYVRQLPLEQITALPFVGGSAASTSVALWDTYQKFFAKADEFRSVKLLGFFAMPSGQIFSLDRPIVQPSDLNGRRMWVLPGDPQKMLSQSRAGVISSPAVQVSELVAGKTVDSIAGISAYNVDAFKVLGYTRAETMIPGGLTTPSFSLIVSRAKWQSIAPADRKAIEAISGAAFARRLSVIDGFAQQALQRGQEGGMKVVQPTPALLEQLHGYAKPLVAQWLGSAQSKGIDGAAALKYFEAQAQAH